MKLKKIRLSTLACVLVSTFLISGCSQTVSDIDNSSENENVSKQLLLLNKSPDFKQTTIDEIKYITTFSSWTEASEILGLDLAPCANDNHSVNYNVLPNYSILQTDLGASNGTLDDDQSNDILQSDFEVISGTLDDDQFSDILGFGVVGGTLDDNQFDGILQPEYGTVGFTSDSDQSYGVESVTVFLPNSKNNQYQCIDSTTTAVKLSDRVSVSADTLYGYFNDFLSIGSGSLPELQWEYIKTVHADRLGIDVDFCTAPVSSFGVDDLGTTNLTQLFAFMIYDGCLFQVSYGIVDGDNIQTVVDLINVQLQ